MTRMGYHWTPCDRGSGGGSGIAVVLIVLAVIVAAIARPVAHAADAVGHVLVDALEIAAIAVASAAGLAALAGMGLLARHVMCRRAEARQVVLIAAPVRPGAPGASQRRPVAAARPPVLARRVRQIEAPKPALYVITSEQRTEKRNP